MKYRKDFVTNSSSTSFVCEICDHSEPGHDSCSAEDYGFWRCEEGEHLICLDCKDEFESDECPICTFKSYSNSEMSQYLQKIYKVERDVVFAEVKKINKRRRVLYNTEYIEYVFKKENLTEDMILEQLRTKFKTHKEYIKFIYKG